MLLTTRTDAKLPPRRRLPPQLPPITIEREYATGLIRLLAPTFAAYEPLIRQAADLAASAKRMDAGEGKRVRDLVNMAREATSKTIKRSDIEALARKFAARTATHQRLQLNKQVHAALGADPVLADRGLAQASDQFVHENAALITTIPEKLHGDVESMVQRAISSSTPSPRLGRQIEERFGISKRHARMISRDQLAKHAGKLNRIRQKELEIDSFQWDAVGDERVRPWHAEELDGNVYRWDKPPRSERGERIFPGDDFQCRCYASPVL